MEFETDQVEPNGIPKPVFFHCLVMVLGKFTLFVVVLLQKIKQMKQSYFISFLL